MFRGCPSSRLRAGKIRGWGEGGFGSFYHSVSRWVFGHSDVRLVISRLYMRAAELSSSFVTTEKALKISPDLNLIMGGKIFVR